MDSATGTHLENIDVNSDGGVLIVSSNLTGQIWDGGLNYLSNDTDICEKITFSHLSKQMLVGLADGVWSDPTHAVVATDEGNVELYTLEDGLFIDPVDLVHHHSYATSVSMASDSTCCVSGSADHFVCTADVKEGKLLRKYQAHSDVVNQVSTHNASPHLFSSCSMDGTVLIWDTRNSKPAKRLTLTNDIVTAVCYHDNKLAVGTERGELLIRDLRFTTTHPLKRVCDHSRPIRRIKFSPFKSDILATCGEDGLVSVVNYNILNTRSIYTSDIHKDFVTGIVWRSVDTLLTCSWDSALYIHTCMYEGTEDTEHITNGHS